MITDKPSPPYAKEFNGLVERNYASLKGTAITILDHSRLPPSYMRFALVYAVLVKIAWSILPRKNFHRINSGSDGLPI
jgi:hypothetical protein